jgi:hypothetical protein
MRLQAGVSKYTHTEINAEIAAITLDRAQSYGVYLRVILIIIKTGNLKLILACVSTR